MKKDAKEYDVIIIGSRVAGSILGSLLGEAGHRVLMLDRPEDYPYYMCVRRVTLDAILVRRARQFVEMHEGAIATELLQEDESVVGVRWRGADGDAEARASVVVGADGLYSFVAKQVEPQKEHEEAVHRIMYFAYFRGVPANAGPAAEFHYQGNSLAYCIPCDDSLTLLAASVPVGRFAEFKRDPEGELLRELDTMPEIRARLTDAQREGPVLGSGNIPGYLRVPYGNGWALVGDAGMVMDPWSGQGIDQAATHASQLARYLGEFLSGANDWEIAMQGYHTARNEFSQKIFRRTCKFGPDLRPMTRAALAKRGLA